MPEASSGFTFDWICVREIELRDPDTGELPPTKNDLPIDLEVGSIVRDDERACRIVITLIYPAKAAQRADGPLLRLRAEAQFSAVGETSVSVRTFSERQGPVLMVPFVREYFARVSSLTRFGQILLNPLNMQKAVTGEHPAQR